MSAMTSTVPVALRSKPASPERKHLPVLGVEAMLKKQQTLTAVERFAEIHDRGELPDKSKVYKSLIPLHAPRIGEQYAFEVDLDACTGCKACVAGCHTLNGLDEAELWRNVGLLHGGTSAEPALQTVTTSCHHCLEPACMAGCPVKAYEKDSITGIVKHLDDQCIGCQYCTLMCPYDAPKYNKARGIVRKCDMCSDRLAHGEEPACVQSCPNDAISIRVVNRDELVEAANARAFLSGAPSPEFSLPSTHYKTAHAMPANMLPADFYRTHPEHSHPPLVVMLIFTQLSVGAYVLGYLVEHFTHRALGSPVAQAAFACSIGIVALLASVFHLGRPWLAWRAVLGLRTSWLSREALAFGVFVKFAVLHGMLTVIPVIWPDLGRDGLAHRFANLAQTAATVCGVAGVFCSVMVYVATRREHWSASGTGFKFFGSMLSLGAAALLTVAAFSAKANENTEHALLWLVLVVTAAKLLFDFGILVHAKERRLSSHKRMAVVMLGDLRAATAGRFALALAGGIFIPWYLLAQVGSIHAPVPIYVVGLLTLMAGELAERYLFFGAAPASRMPGSFR